MRGCCGVPTKTGVQSTNRVGTTSSTPATAEKTLVRIPFAPHSVAHSDGEYAYSAALRHTHWDDV